jgi:hypothetical protein
MVFRLKMNLIANSAREASIPLLSKMVHEVGNVNHANVMQFGSG